jgi:long-subunit fatty acid transport protein
MKNIKKYLFSVFVICSLQLQAQNETDALRYSHSDLPVTARSLGMGGATGAIGADVSNFFNNPAGLGAYKRGAFDFSLSFNDQLTSTNYTGVQSESQKSRVLLNNLGLIASRKIKSGKWKEINFGIAYGKSNQFNQDMTIRGKDFTSLLIPFSLQADGTLPSDITNNFPFSAGPAYETYAINPTDSTGQFYAPASSGVAEQTKVINRTGSQGETSFGLGLNYNDKVQFGFSLNFLGLTFTERSTYTEVFEPTEELTNLSFQEYLRTDGTGVNAKLGVLVRPSKLLRAGLAYHTRMRITLHDLYNTGMNTTVNGIRYEFISPDLITDYVVRTPARLLANAAFLLGDIGVISADYEYTNYDRIRMRGSITNNYDYAAENNTIRSIYQSTHNVRAGIEMRVHNSLYLRAGAAYRQNPVSEEMTGDVAPDVISYHGGVGYRSDYFFADLGLSIADIQSTYYLYDPKFVEPTTIKSRITTGILSVGMRF